MGTTSSSDPEAKRDAIVTDEDFAAEKRLDRDDENLDGEDASPMDEEAFEEIERKVEKVKVLVEAAEARASTAELRARNSELKAENAELLAREAALNARTAEINALSENFDELAKFGVKKPELAAQAEKYGARAPEARRRRGASAREPPACARDETSVPAILARGVLVVLGAYEDQEERMDACDPLTRGYAEEVVGAALRAARNLSLVSRAAAAAARPLMRDLGAARVDQTLARLERDALHRCRSLHFLERAADSSLYREAFASRLVKTVGPVVVSTTCEQCGEDGLAALVVCARRGRDSIKQRILDALRTKLRKERGTTKKQVETFLKTILDGEGWRTWSRAVFEDDDGSYLLRLYEAFGRGESSRKAEAELLQLLNDDDTAAAAKKSKKKKKARAEPPRAPEPAAAPEEPESTESTDDEVDILTIAKANETKRGRAAKPKRAPVPAPKRAPSLPAPPAAAAPADDASAPPRAPAAGTTQLTAKERRRLKRAAERADGGAPPKPPPSRAPPPVARPEGVIRSTVDDRYGFIHADDEKIGRDLFFLWSALASRDDDRKATVGERVAFDLGPWKGKLVAQNITKIAPAPQLADLQGLLVGLRLGHLLPVFVREEIDMETLPLLEPDDFLQIGVSRGDAATIMAALSGGSPATDPPDDLVCPISFEIMSDPVLAEDGNTYERACIEAWFAKSKTSPLTGAPLASPKLRPNLLVRRLTANFLEQRGR